MKSFLKYFFASFLAFFIVIFFTIILVVTITFSPNKGDIIRVKDNSILVINLEKNIPEKAPNDFSINDIFNDHESSGTNLLHALKAIHHAKTDDKIKGIALYFSAVNSSLSTTEEIRKALHAFKESGKFIYAFGDALSLKNHYIASVANQIYLNPLSYIEWKGIGARLLFFKNALDKLDIEMQIFYQGKYKSATEPYRNTSMSEASKQQMKVIVDQYYQYVLETICSARDISFETLNEATKNLNIITSNDALALKLIDKTANEAEFDVDLKDKLGLKSDDEMNTITLSDYTQHYTSHIGKNSKSAVAVVYAQGVISDNYNGTGGSGDDEIREKQYLEILSEIENDDNIKAMVLRVNSPGGDLKASDRINEAIQRVKDQKPVIVSMADVAASGGYYISCHADKILADNTTLTGSIGIFAMIPNIKNMLSKKLGITQDGVEAVPNSNFDILAPLTKKQSEAIRKFIKNGYNSFKSNVSTGRGMDLEQVDELAQGRVWTSIDAEKNSLIDSIGGLLDAIEVAKQSADISSSSIKEFPKKLSVLESLSHELKGVFYKDPMTNFANHSKVAFILNHIKSIENQTNSIQARLPYNVYIE